MPNATRSRRVAARTATPATEPTPAVEPTNATDAPAPSGRKVIEPHPCACQHLVLSSGKRTGCTRTLTTNATWAPGHDAKTKSLLILAIYAGLTVDYVPPTGEATRGVNPLELADAREWGFAHQIRAAAARAAA